MQKIHLHEDYNYLKKDLINFLQNFSNEGEFVTKGERNIIKKVNLQGITINVKRFKKPMFFNAFIYKFLRASKAKRSFNYAKKLLNVDILTPFPVAYVEEFSAFGLEDSYYVSMQVDYDFDFRVLIHKQEFPDRDAILRQFAAFTFKLHENKVNFLDHSPGNTLIVKKGYSLYDFYLIDLNRMRFEFMDFNKRMHNFRRLWLSKAMIKIIADAYAKLYNKSFNETHGLMLEYTRRFQTKKNSKKLRKQGRSPKFKSE